MVLLGLKEEADIYRGLGELKASLTVNPFTKSAVPHYGNDMGRQEVPGQKDEGESDSEI